MTRVATRRIKISIAKQSDKLNTLKAKQTKRQNKYSNRQRDIQKVAGIDPMPMSCPYIRAYSVNISQTSGIRNNKKGY